MGGVPYLGSDMQGGGLTFVTSILTAHGFLLGSLAVCDIVGYALKTTHFVVTQCTWYTLRLHAQ